MSDDSRPPDRNPGNVSGLAYELDGSGSPLLVLHGFTGSSADWAQMLPELTAHHTVIAPDIIGHGHSPAPSEPSAYQIEQAVADLLALLDRLDYVEFDLLGYSMGGRVAMALAATAPQRVRHMILESASPGIADPQERAARAAADDHLADRIEGEGLEWFVDHWAGIPLFASQSRLPETARTALRKRRLCGSARGYANSLRGMGAGRMTPLWDRLPYLPLPTLVISGELDQKYAAIGEQIARIMPRAEHVIVPDAGHTVHLEAPQAFAQIVVRYLEKP